MPDYRISFKNFSDVALTRQQCFYPTLKTGPVHDISIPSQNGINADGGVETLAWDVYMQLVASGPYYGGVVYNNPTTGYRFGVRIHVPLQAVHIGASPEWQVLYHEVADWTTPVDEPGTSWNSPDSWAKDSGMKVRIDAVAGGTSLDVTVTISKYTENKNKSKPAIEYI